jgi:Flp pilus assembly protein TadG
VEFAILIPVVLLMFGAIIQFGFAFNAQVTLTQAAREGARVASLNPISATCNTNCVYAAVVPKTVSGAPGLTLDSTASSLNTQITVTPCAAGSSQTTDAVVIITYQFNIGAPLVNKTLTLHGKAHMPCGG